LSVSYGGCGGGGDDHLDDCACAAVVVRRLDCCVVVVAVADVSTGCDGIWRRATQTCVAIHHRTDVDDAVAFAVGGHHEVVDIGMRHFGSADRNAIDSGRVASVCAPHDPASVPVNAPARCPTPAAAAASVDDDAAIPEQRDVDVDRNLAISGGVVLVVIRGVTAVAAVEQAPAMPASQVAQYLRMELMKSL
jgi:hypothetical protein